MNTLYDRPGVALEGASLPAATIMPGGFALSGNAGSATSQIRAFA